MPTPVRRAAPALTPVRAGLCVGWGDRPPAILAAMPASPAPPAVACDPEIMGGTPVFAGTRVPADTLFHYLRAGDRLDDFLDDFPTVTRDQAVRLLEWAAGAAVRRAA